MSDGPEWRSGFLGYSYISLLPRWAYYKQTRCNYSYLELNKLENLI